MLQRSPHSDCCGGGHNVLLHSLQAQGSPAVTFTTSQLARPECQSGPIITVYLGQGSLSKQAAMATGLLLCLLRDLNEECWAQRRLLSLWSTSAFDIFPLISLEQGFSNYGS